ncbi:hypothetical protein [Halococcus sp. AFM35]|uniref:hypothetical protein n=1 Tax=Halococcus sp. AFM35 TaxID=3421653 RepID=UPI003EBE3DEF
MASSTSAPTDADESNADRTDTSAVLPEDASLSIPASADRAEAAAIAVAIGAHLRDRAAGTDDTSPEHCDRWTLCGRFGGRTPPPEVVRGEEWKAAGRVRR